MASTKSIGDFYENKASKIYEDLGGEILERNYRFGRNEIDIITLSDDVIVFIEVKYRKITKFGFPEEWVTQEQQNRILECAENYTAAINWSRNIRFDIVAFTKNDVHLFIDAF